MTEPSEWLESLVDSVADCIEATAPFGSVRYRWLNEADEFWEVTVHSTPVELVGGAVDGEIVYPVFSLDLLGLSSCFDEVTDFRWHAHDLSPQASDGPHLTVEGCTKATASAPSFERTP